MDEQPLRQRFIPENVLKGKRIFGFKRRNITEGIIEALIICFILYQIPFVTKVRWIIILCVALFILLINCIGIKNQSYTQIIKNYVDNKKYIKQYSYRRLNYAKQNKPILSNGKVRTIKENRATQNIKKIIGQ